MQMLCGNLINYFNITLSETLRYEEHKHAVLNGIYEALTTLDLLTSQNTCFPFLL